MVKCSFVYWLSNETKAETLVPLGWTLQALPAYQVTQNTTTHAYSQSYGPTESDTGYTSIWAKVTRDLRFFPVVTMQYTVILRWRLWSGRRQCFAGTNSLLLQGKWTISSGKCRGKEKMTGYRRENGSVSEVGFWVEMVQDGQNLKQRANSVREVEMWMLLIVRG